MKPIEVIRTIQAPVSKVFDTVADIREFSQAVEGVVRFEILSEIQRGVGLRFRETRMMGKREATEELEITECVENEHVRIVCDSHGTVWDTVFRTKEASGGGTELSMVMDAKNYKFFSKIMTFLIRGMIAKAIEKDMDAVKVFCER